MTVLLSEIPVEVSPGRPAAKAELPVEKVTCFLGFGRVCAETGKENVC